MHFLIAWPVWYPVLFTFLFQAWVFSQRFYLIFSFSKWELGVRERQSIQCNTAIFWVEILYQHRNTKYWHLIIRLLLLLLDIRFLATWGEVIVMSTGGSWSNKDWGTGERNQRSTVCFDCLQQRWDKRDVNDTWKYHKHDGSHAAPSCDNVSWRWQS